MWFNILKLDFKNLQNKIQSDKEADPINIRENKKCRDRIKNFTSLSASNSGGNLYAEFGYDKWSNTGFMHDKIPEEVYCMIVETLDKFFSQEFKNEGIPNQTVNRIKESFGQYPNNYSLFIFSIIGDKSSNPFTMILSAPKHIDKYDFEIEFNPVLDNEELSIQKYEKIKSRWERA